MDLQEISDRLEIEALLTRYTRAIDTGEWDRLDDVFTPDATIDYTATVAAYFPNPMMLPQEGGEGLLVEFGGIYHRLRRTSAGWRSYRLFEELVWKRGL